MQHHTQITHRIAHGRHLYRAHIKYDAKVMFSAFLSFCPHGRGLQETSAGGGGGSSTNFNWGGGGVFNQFHLGEGGLQPTFIVVRCYQSAHLWPIGGTERLYLLI